MKRLTGEKIAGVMLIRLINLTVGKTSLITRFMYDGFECAYQVSPPTGTHSRYISVPFFGRLPREFFPSKPHKITYFKR